MLDGSTASDKFLVTLFADKGAKTLATREVTLAELGDLAVNTTADSKDRLPLLKLARFGDRRTEKGSLRHDANVESATGVEMDYDGEVVSFEEALAVIKRARLRALLYTSPSHASDKPRWRVVAPFSRALPPQERAKMAARINGIFDGIFSRESFTLSQAFYYGHVNGSAFQVAGTDGDCVDERGDLDASARGSGSAESAADNVVNFPGSAAGATVEGLPPMLGTLLHILNAGRGKPHGDYHSRSELMFAFVTGALRVKVSEATITAACLDGARRGCAVFEHIREKTNPRAYVAEQIKNAKVKLYDKEIGDINKDHALVLAGNKSAIMKLEGKSRFRLLQIGAFQHWFANQRITVDDKAVPLANYWLAHKQRRQYEGIEFAPSGGRQGYYNLWRGFSVEPRAGDCSKFLDHLKDNVAQGNTSLYEWVVGWFAQIVQQPTVKPGTALCLRGKQGVGKTKVGQIVGSLFEDHYELVADPRYIVGQFNSHMAQLLLLHADEAFWAGDKRAEGKLKDLVTGLRHRLEFKGVDPIAVQNLIRLFVTGNQDWLVPAGFGERRFAVIDVGEARKEDHDYFATIDKEMDEGGREALLHHLLNFDLFTVNLRVIPKTEALVEQIIETATPEQAWWLDTLERGELPWGVLDPDTNSSTCIKNMCPKKTLFRRYIQHANLQGTRRRAIEVKIGMFLNKYVGSDLKCDQKKKYSIYHRSGRRLTEIGWVYTFPPLKDCRQRFAKEMQQPIAWDDADADWTHEAEQVEDEDVPF